MTHTFLSVPKAPSDAERAALERAGVHVLARDASGEGRTLDGRHELLRCSAHLADDVRAVRERQAIPWVLVEQPSDLAAADAAGAGVWLRGLEAAGPVGDTSALVLIRAAAGARRSWVVEGLGERGQAAALAVGAAGIVLDGPLWACAGQLELDGVRTGRDTRVIGEATGHRVRVLSRGRPEAIALDGAPTARVLGALRSGELLAAPQSIGACVAHRGEPLLDAALALRAAIVERSAAARAHHGLREDPLGTGAAVVQGPMANVTEQPGLAAAVLAAGGLPFCALGALRSDGAAEVLHRFSSLARWGAGVIGFDVMPHRDDHLRAVAATGPRPVILAGGSVVLAQRVAAMGLEPWLHTPDAVLVEAALQAQLPAVVLEGHEAGGHVGPITSVGLWEECLARVEVAAHHPLVVLAGGIGDAVSAAFAAAMSAQAHAVGSPIALQAGTAFFFTHEIVESGQIPLAYQEAALAAEHTELVGATVNLPLR